MAKARQVFVCRQCGGVQNRWMGKCPDCGAWDALEEQRVDKGAAKDPQRGVVEAWAAITEGRAGAPPDVGGGAGSAEARPISAIGEGGGDGPSSRIRTGISELDRVLGGGLVPGSAILVGGDPGIGKSTLMLQAAGAMARTGVRALYVSSEESAQQVKLRAERLGVGGPRPGGPRGSGLVHPEGREEEPDELFILADTNLARIVEQVRRTVPSVLVIDSVQMIYKADLDASPGSITQLRRCCAELVYLAKLSGIAVILVGHVTKEGALAGPRLLEHLVDAVLYFEGDRYHAHRIVRAVKNRYGTTLEIGIFEMTGEGLREVPEGLGVSAVLGPGTGAGGTGGEGGEKGRAGSVVCPVITGTRCVLVELQALTATGFLGSAKRKSSGLDGNRLAMLIAVLEQHAGLRLADRDVFASAVGGIRVAEPAADLALLLAIAGAHYRRALAPRTAVVGEVGLGGEVRPVNQLEQRIKEASRLGFTRTIVPAGRGAKRGAPKGGSGGTDGKGEVVPVRTIGEAIEELG